MNTLTGTGSSNFTKVYPKIYLSDFDAHYSLSDMASRIATDLKYEEGWKRIAENKNNLKKRGTDNVKY